MSALTTMKEVIQGHNVVHLATIDKAGDPCVRALVYASGDEDNILYLLTRDNSRKIEHIWQSPNIGFAIDRDVKSREELTSIKYIKGKGTAVIVSDRDDMQKALDALVAKFPFLAAHADNPADIVVIRLLLQEVIVSDHSIRIGHTEEVNF